VAGSCEHGNEPSGSAKCGEFPDYLRNCQLVKKESAAWIKLLCRIILYSLSTHRPEKRLFIYCSPNKGYSIFVI
jgi:hypothetical protein